MKSVLTKSLIMALSLGCSLARAEPVDLEVIHRIKEEAFHHSQVMDYLYRITDENGPRITGSPGFARAADRAVETFKEAGVPKAGLETWGVFGRGWSWSRIAVQMEQPYETTLTAFPGDWSSATDGPVSGEVVFAPLWDEGDEPKVRDLVKLAEQIEAYKAKYAGKLAGKVVMLAQPRHFTLPETPETFRWTDEQLADLGHGGYDQPLMPGPVPPVHWPLIRYPLDKEQRSRLWDVMPLEIMADFWMRDLEVGNRLRAFLRDQEVAAVLTVGWAKGAAVIMNSDYGSWVDGDPIPPPTAVLMPEQYSQLYHLVERGVPVNVQVDIDAQFYGPGVEGKNVIAEIPAARHGKEVVMLGAHLDSWHGAVGATDNGAGSAVVMEVMRILASLDLPMRRTVRAALWSGEEQCLCGSRYYVAKHYADPVTMQLKPEHALLSAYFNLDNGGGRIRGVYLQQNDMARPIFEAWLRPFADLGVSEVTIINTTGTDHLSFNQVGLPGFNFIQDPLDYELNTHHSNVDQTSHIIPGDLMQAAAVMAAAVYQAAVREDMMPRQPLPPPLPPRGELPDILK